MQRRREPRQGAAVGFVPTMGALHEGHLSLIHSARRDCAVVVVSIFVNPTQFGAGEDFTSYPRDLDRDLAQCEAAGADVVFVPSADEVYGQECLTTVRVAGVSEPLCGRHRPGHFEGVALVVLKLFNIVGPDRAYFGQKDAQQAAVIRQMVRDLNLPLHIVVCSIVREHDGLAMSSRNRYLDPAQRQHATVLHRSLQQIRQEIEQGGGDVRMILRRARNLIEDAGPCDIDYVELVDPVSMQPVGAISGPVLAAVAVRIGTCRLIDNLLIDSPAASG